MDFDSTGTVVVDSTGTVVVDSTGTVVVSCTIFNLSRRVLLPSGERLRPTLCVFFPEGDISVCFLIGMY